MTKSLKPLILCLSVVLITSCGELTEAEKAANDFCECTDKKAGSERNTCFEDWNENYNGIKISEEEIQSGKEKVEKCSSGLSATRFERRIKKIKK